MAFLAGIATIGTVYADGEGNSSFSAEELTPEKQSAISESQIVDPGEVEFGTAEVVEPVADSGDAAKVLAVKTAVPILLRQDASVGRMPNLEPSLRTVAVTATSAVTLVDTTLKNVWSPQVVAGEVQTWLSSLQLAAADPNYIPYSDNSFTVSEWQGVQVDGNAATATFLGHNSYKLPDGWKSDPDDQYQMTLQYVSGLLGVGSGWRLSNVTIIDSADFGNED
ncbi:hypothetical protein [Aeromicrobium sp.]|uniref:hypothetical protein n=1 Tax=Aeromicrobium sp. TaxID=1871063 RepID=UPI0039E3F87B